MKKVLSEEQKKRRAESAREWRRKNPERAKEHAQRSRDRNYDKIRARQAAWVEHNREYVQEKARAYYQKNRDRVRENNWKKTFGITAEQYHTLLKIQDGRCAICKTDTPGKGEWFAVDHDHKTGLIRGLLCVHCNVGLGHFQDAPDLLITASEYLRDRHGTVGPLGSAGLATCS